MATSSVTGRRYGPAPPPGQCPICQTWFLRKPTGRNRLYCSQVCRKRASRKNGAKG